MPSSFDGNCTSSPPPRRRELERRCTALPETRRLGAGSFERPAGSWWNAASVSALATNAPPRPIGTVPRSGTSKPPAFARAHHLAHASPTAIGGGLCATSRSSAHAVVGSLAPSSPALHRAPAHRTGRGAGCTVGRLATASASEADAGDDARPPATSTGPAADSTGAAADRSSDGRGCGCDTGRTAAPMWIAGLWALTIAPRRRQAARRSV